MSIVFSRDCTVFDPPTNCSVSYEQNNIERDLKQQQQQQQQQQRVIILKESRRDSISNVLRFGEKVLLISVCSYHWKLPSEFLYFIRANTMQLQENPWGNHFNLQIDVTSHGTYKMECVDWKLNRMDNSRQLKCHCFLVCFCPVTTL